MKTFKDSHEWGIQWYGKQENVIGLLTQKPELLLDKAFHFKDEEKSAREAWQAMVTYLQSVNS